MYALSDLAVAPSVAPGRSAPHRHTASPVARGFTLIELLVTVALVATLASLAAPSVSQLWRRQLALNAVSALASDVALARAEALQRATSVSLCATQDGSTCLSCSGLSSTACAPVRNWSRGWMLFLDPDADGQRDAVSDSLLRRQGAASGGLQITDRNGLSAGDALVYRPLGWAVGESRSFVVSHPELGDGWCLVISSNGRASVRSARRDTTQWTCAT